MLLSVLVSALMLAGATTSSSLCIQGCCDQKIDLSSTEIKLHPISGNGQMTTIELESPELQCCPCPVKLDAKASVNTTGGKPDPIFGTECEEGDCEPWCDCSRRGEKRPPPKNKLRPLCEAGKCDQQNCLCREEMLQGFHDLFFGSADKGGSKTLASWDAFAKKFGQKVVDSGTAEKEEL
ncbi:hypothetical protein BT63DRAFT_145078 [Microthyrium microscopicum]|uniref:Uncharacterized protein n=1 Tax=Microthyrium microscopicum TaxID=703497 RepID=A0A6A6UL86_9PEZI|nr:hypothetical protein BT63DRAFT_145078 [Microthyrium microscopicum]